MISIAILRPTSPHLILFQLRKVTRQNINTVHTIESGTYLDTGLHMFGVPAEGFDAHQDERAARLNLRLLQLILEL